MHSHNSMHAKIESTNPRSDLEWLEDNKTPVSTTKGRSHIPLEEEKMNLSDCD
ncbi:hypothetical protein Hanom_Chr00s000290g01634061 [Helianthus anomalus]